MSEAQSKVWQGLVNTNANRVREFVFIPQAEIKNEVEDEHKNEKEDANEDKKRAFIRREPPRHVNIEKEVRIVINEVELDQQGNQPWIELNPGAAESPEQMMEIAEAKLVAHTELLGPLDERAARRLALVATGVAQESIEAQDKDRDAIDELWRDGESRIDITDHPMYQQTIKDVLSEEALARYSEYKVERKAWYQQILRDIVVACLDTQLLLDDMQRKQLETAASQLIPAPIGGSGSSTFMFFQLFPQTVDFEVLTPWQRGEFERVFGPLARIRR